jgi:hypothetical protein
MPKSKIKQTPFGAADYADNPELPCRRPQLPITLRSMRSHQIGVKGIVAELRARAKRAGAKPSLGRWPDECGGEDLANRLGKVVDRL